MLACAAVIVGLELLYRRTLIGRAFLAIAEDNFAARALGLPERSLRMASFALAGVIGALAGFAGGEMLLAFFANAPMLTFYGFVPVALGGNGQTTVAPSLPASCSDCFSRPLTSWLAASSPRWRSSPCSSSSCWRAPRVSPALPSHDAFDGYAANPVTPEPRGCDRRCEPIQSGAALPGAARCRHLVPVVRRRLLGCDRDPRLCLLGVGVRPQPGRRVRRPDRDRLGGAAHARRTIPPAFSWPATSRRRCLPIWR